jgi:hypothetical protein
MMELKLKAIAGRLVHPLRAPVGWVSRHGLLPPQIGRNWLCLSEERRA